MPAGKLFPIRGKGLVLRAGCGTATCVSPAPARGIRKDLCCPQYGRPAPAMGGSGAVGFGPPAGPDPGAALWQGQCFRLFGRDRETQRVSTARARRSPVDREVREQRRPAPDPAGEKRPPGAGRALAGGCGPRLVKGPCGAAAGAMAPAKGAVKVPSPVRAGPGNAPRFPRPLGPVPRRPAGPGDTEASARPGGREAPAGGGAGAGRGLWPPAGQGSAGRCGRGDGPCHCSGESAFVSAGGEGNATRVSPARAERCPVDRRVRE